MSVIQNYKALEVSPSCGLVYQVSLVLSSRTKIIIPHCSTWYSPHTVLLFSLSVVFLIILFKRYQIFTQRLIMYLSIAAIFQAIGYIMVRNIC